MKIEIDQSGKIEKTNKQTVFGFSNSVDGTILIKAKDKKYLQEMFRKAGQSRIFIHKIFSIAVYHLIKDHLKSFTQIIIDREYPGYDKLIKQLVIELFERDGIKIDRDIIVFREIGKKSNAHRVSNDAYKKSKAD